MDSIHQVALTNFPTIANYIQTIVKVDIIKPREANRCFLCVDKLIGAYPIALTEKFDMLEIFCDAVQNSYRYNGLNNNSTAIRANLLDTFVSQAVVGPIGANFYVATYNTLNNNDKWLEIPIDRLNNLQFSFTSNTTNPVASVLHLHLKVKFM